MYKRQHAPFVTWQDVLALWLAANDEFYGVFTGALCSSSHADFFWECPPVSAQTLQNPFEFVLIDAGGRLAGTKASAADFQEHVCDAHGRPLNSRAVAFPNLGGDAVLVVPTQVESFPKNMCATASLCRHLLACLVGLSLVLRTRTPALGLSLSGGWWRVPSA